MVNMTKQKPRTRTPKLPEREVRNDRLSFRCPVVLRQAIEALAAKDRRTVSDWIVIALNEIVNRREY